MNPFGRKNYGVTLDLAHGEDVVTDLAPDEAV